MKSNTESSRTGLDLIEKHVYEDRVDAGKHLARKLYKYKNMHPIVFGLPRGGVPVAYQVAEELETVLDILAVHKIGAPFNQEFAIGAVGENNTVVLDTDTLIDLGMKTITVARLIAEQQTKINIQAETLRGGKPVTNMTDKTIIIVDDGLATGATASAAVAVARKMGARHIILAVPVGSQTAVNRLRKEADEVICLDIPDKFYAVGEFYKNFEPTTDSEVISLLQRASTSLYPHSITTHAELDKDIMLSLSPELTLAGHLTLPDHATSIVLFAHGSGSSRFSPRNKWVAELLNNVGIGTLLFDLLTEKESIDRENVFDIELLAARLTNVKKWVLKNPETSNLSIGFFGASTGAAAALVSAADHPDHVEAIVSRGGRPDLANDWLPKVNAPTLLLVGGKDTEVLKLNQAAQMRMRCTTRLTVIPGATHLFEELGTLRTVADMASAWFADYLTPPMKQAI